MSRRVGASTGGAGQKLQRVLTVVRQAGSGCDVDTQLLECLQLAKAVCAREPDAAAEFLEEARPLAELVRRHAALDVRVRSSTDVAARGSGTASLKSASPSLHWQVVEAVAHVVAAGAQAGHALQTAPPRLDEGDEDAGSDDDSDSDAADHAGGVPWWDLWTALLESAAGALTVEPATDGAPISLAEAQRLTMLLAALVSAFLRIVRPPPAFGKGRWRRALRYLSPAAAPAADAATAGAGGVEGGRRARALQPIYGEDSDSDSDGDSDTEADEVEDEHAAVAAEAAGGAAEPSSGRVAATSLLRPAVQAAVLRAARRAPDSLVALDTALSRIGSRLMQAASAFGPELRPVEVVGAALVRLPLLQLELRRTVAASALLPPATEPLPRLLAGVHWLSAAAAHLARRLPASQALIESLLADARLGLDAAAVVLLRGDLRGGGEATPAAAAAAAAGAAALSCAALAPHCFSPPLLATARAWQAAVVAASRKDKDKGKGKGSGRSRKEREKEKEKELEAAKESESSAAGGPGSGASLEAAEAAFFVTAGVTPALAQESLAELQGLCAAAMGSGAVLAALTQLLLSRSSAADAGDGVAAAVAALRRLISADVAAAAGAGGAAHTDAPLDAAAAALWLGPSAAALQWPWQRLQRLGGASGSASSGAEGGVGAPPSLLPLLSHQAASHNALLSVAWVCVPVSASGPTADDAAAGGACASAASAGAEGKEGTEGMHAVMPPAVAEALPDAARALAAAASGADAPASTAACLPFAPLAAAARALAGSSPACLSLAADAAAAVTTVHAALHPSASAAAAAASGAAAAAAVAGLLSTAWQPLAAGLRQLPRYSPPMQELLLRAFRRLVSAAETCLSAQSADASAAGADAGALCAFVLESGPAAARTLLAHVSGAWEASVVDAPPLLSAGEVAAAAGDAEGRSVDAQHVTLLLETCAACGALLAAALRNDAVFAAATAVAARSSTDLMVRAFATAVRHGYAVLRLKGVVEVESGAAYNVGEGGSDEDDDEDEEEEDETEGLTDFSVVCAAMLGALLRRLNDKDSTADTLTDAGLAAAAAAWSERAGGDSVTTITGLVCKPVADRLLPLFRLLVGRAAVFEADAAMDVLAARIVSALPSTV